MDTQSTQEHMQHCDQERVAFDHAEPNCMNRFEAAQVHDSVHDVVNMISKIESDLLKYDESITVEGDLPIIAVNDAMHAAWMALAEVQTRVMKVQAYAGEVMERQLKEVM